jgi:flagellar motor protein MotB
MKTRWFAASFAVLVLCQGGCTTRYQDLLRDRDAHIGELKGEVADLRATNADLERRERAARTEQKVTAEPASLSKTAEPNDLGRIKNDLADLDVRYSRGRLSIGIENTVTFASGSTTLKSSASQTLKRVADVLKREFADRRIYVEGHTDGDPIQRTKARFRSNRHLSAERADIVADFLVRHGGIDKSKVVVVGFGAHDPREQGQSGAAKARNRRVEIVVGEPM